MYTREVSENAKTYLLFTIEIDKYKLKSIPTNWDQEASSS